MCRRKSSTLKALANRAVRLVGNTGLGPGRWSPTLGGEDGPRNTAPADHTRGSSDAASWVRISRCSGATMLEILNACLGPSTKTAYPPVPRVASRSPRRGDAWTMRSTWAVTASATSSDQVMSQARPSGPCSACTTRSMAASSGGVSGPALTTTSARPAKAAAPPPPAGPLRLGLGPVAVPGPDDHVDRSNRFGPVRHGRNGLGPTYPIDLIDTGHCRGRQGGVVDGAVGTGGHAQHHLFDSGHPGRNGTHENGGGVSGPSSRGVTTGPGHRAGEVGDGDPGRFEIVGLRRCRLMGVVGENPVVSDIEGVL